MTTWTPGSKAYAAGAGAALAEPVKDFIVNFGIWAGGDEIWLKPLGVIIAIGIGFGLAYIAPQQTQILSDVSVRATTDEHRSTSGDR